MTGPVEYRLEVVVVPVSDVDASRDFYVERMGFIVDHDTRIDERTRVVQLTPRGSACSIVIGTGLAEMTPGSLTGLQLVVADMDAARADLAGRGVEVGEIVEMGRPGRPGFRFSFLTDPDGNGWTIQEIRPG